MNTPRFKTKELLLMLLPIGVLAVIGLWLRGKPGPTLQATGPFKFVVDDWKFEPATPLQASSGYNRILAVRLGHEGRTPVWWGKDNMGATGCGIGLDPTTLEKIKLHQKPNCWLEGGALTYKEGQVTKTYLRPDKTSPMSMHSIRWDAGLNRYAIKYAIGLPQIPDEVGEVTLKGLIAAGLSPPTLFSIVVRKAGEKVVTPQVSKYSPAVLDKVIVESSATETRVKVLIFDKERSTPREGNAGWGQGMPYLIGENGTQYGWPGNKKTGWGGMIVEGISYNQEFQRYITTYRFDLSTIPQAAGKLTFKTNISLDDHWPISVSRVVRERQKPQLVQGKPKPRPTQKPITITHYKY